MIITTMTRESDLSLVSGGWRGRARSDDEEEEEENTPKWVTEEEEEVLK